MTCTTSSVVGHPLPCCNERPAGKGRPRLSDARSEAVRDVMVRNTEGLHARPVMRFVDLASKYESEVSVTNVSRGNETVDGKSAMQMMLLEASKGSVLRIVALGRDAREAVSALEALISGGFDSDASQQPE